MELVARKGFQYYSEADSSHSIHNVFCCGSSRLVTTIPKFISILVCRITYTDETLILQRLSTCTQLTKLLLRFEHMQHVPNISPISTLTNLQDICIFGGPADLSAFQHMRELRSFNYDCRGRRIDQGFFIPGLGSLPCAKLERLNLGGLRIIEDISALSAAVNLVHLDLTDNETLTDLSPLRHCTKLEYLNLYDCESVVDISPLSSCVSLTRLNLTGTSVDCFCPLRSLPKLTEDNWFYLTDAEKRLLPERWL